MDSLLNSGYPHTSATDDLYLPLWTDSSKKTVYRNRSKISPVAYLQVTKCRVEYHEKCNWILRSVFAFEEHWDTFVNQLKSKIIFHSSNGNQRKFKATVSSAKHRFNAIRCFGLKWQRRRQKRVLLDLKFNCTKVWGVNIWIMDKHVSISPNL